MKKTKIVLLFLLFSLVLASCDVYVPMYGDVLPKGMEESVLKARAFWVMEQLGDGDFSTLSSERIKKRDLEELQDDYEEILERMGGHRKCNFVSFGMAQGLTTDEPCAFVYMHCNHEYGEIDWYVYFDADYRLLGLEMLPDEGSVRDPRLEKI